MIPDSCSGLSSVQQTVVYYHRALRQTKANTKNLVKYSVANFSEDKITDLCHLNLKIVISNDKYCMKLSIQKYIYCLFFYS